MGRLSRMRPPNPAHRSRSTKLRVIAVIALAIASLVISITPGSAGQLMTITLTKVVKGTAPSGASFVVHFVCSGGSNFTGDSTFVATGGTANIPVGFPSTCTFSETGNGGADNVDFSCTGATNVICNNDHQVTNTNSGNPTITVTNAYSNALGAVTVTPSPATPGQHVTVSGANCTKALFGGSAATGGDVEVTVDFPTPITLNTTAAGTTGAWSAQFTVPAGALGPYTVSAICDDPIPYATSALTVTAAPTPGAPAAAVQPVTAVPTTTG